MSTNISIISGFQPTSAAVINAYTSPPAGAGTRILAFTSTNKAGNQTAGYRVFIGTAATNEQEIIPETFVAGSASDSPLELVGHLILPNESLWIQSTIGSTITFRATGIEF